MTVDTPVRLEIDAENSWTIYDQNDEVVCQLIVDLDLTDDDTARGECLVELINAHGLSDED